jgi:hypothetical protein
MASEQRATAPRTGGQRTGSGGQMTGTEARGRPAGAGPPPAARSSLPARLTAGGTDGNERLTSEAGAVLFVLLAALGITILRIGTLLWIHLFVGLLLLGPVALKLISTGYRFTRYYTSEPRYRRKGPPELALRLLAPLVVLSTLVVFASGVALLLRGPSSRGSLLLIHKVSFFVWLAVTALHVLGHLRDMRRTLLGARAVRGAVFASTGAAGGDSPLPPAGGSERAGSEPTGRSGRALALAAALLAGLVLALALIPQFGPWVNDNHGRFGPARVVLSR